MTVLPWAIVVVDLKTLVHMSCIHIGSVIKDAIFLVSTILILYLECKILLTLDVGFILFILWNVNYYFILFMIYIYVLKTRRK